VRSQESGKRKEIVPRVPTDQGAVQWRRQEEKALAQEDQLEEGQKVRRAA